MSVDFLICRFSRLVDIFPRLLPSLLVPVAGGTHTVRTCQQPLYAFTPVCAHAHASPRTAAISHAAPSGAQFSLAASLASPEHTPTSAAGRPPPRAV